MQPGGYFDHAVWEGGYLGHFCLHDNIRLWNKISLIVFSALKCFFFLFLYFIQDK